MEEETEQSTREVLQGMADSTEQVTDEVGDEAVKGESGVLCLGSVGLQRPSYLFKATCFSSEESFIICFSIERLFCQELCILSWDLAYTSGLINFDLSVQPKEYHYSYLTTSKKCN